MKRGPAIRLPKAAASPSHRFPAVTLMCSVALLLGGLGLADLLPMPHLPRLSSFSSRTSPGQAQASLSLPEGRDFGPLGPPPPAGYPAEGLGRENITLNDVAFLPIRVPLWPMASRLIVRANQGNLSLIDPRTESPVWLGSAASARFIYSSIAGTQTLSDEKGQVFWSDIPMPDLRFETRPDGTAQLSDKHGKTLWAGPLAGDFTSGIARSDHQGTIYTLEFNGIRVNGNNGSFTVIDGTGPRTRVLWSGTLPVQPVLLFRDKHQFLFLGRDRAESGTDRTADIRLIGETATVAITDARQQTLGVKSVEILKVESIVHLQENDKLVSTPVQYCVPQGDLAKSGAVLLTYRDAQGHDIRKNSVIRDGDRQRISSSGLPY